MPDIGAVGNAGENPAALTELQRSKTKQPVDRRGMPLPVRKSGYDALDKNSFLKLLVTQLAKQDPTNPMNDREFISQMAQFSSLEQMNNVANSMNKLRASQANQLIGKMVSGKDFVTDKPLQGIVTSSIFSPNGDVLLKVNGRHIKLDDISEVTEVTPMSPPVIPPARGGERGGDVSRETIPIPLPSSPASGGGAGGGGGTQRITVQPPASEAAKAYEANQKAAMTSAPAKAEAPTAPMQSGTEVQKNKMNDSKGE